MNKWLALASSSVVALMLVAPAGVGAQGRHPSSEGTPTGGSAVSRGDGGGAAPSGSSGSSVGTSQPVPLPRVPSEASGSRRSRGDRPQVGTAQARTYRPSLPSFDGPSRPLPYWWYSAYLPGAYGAYDLWSWGYRPDSWWYSPFGYSPYGYLPYGSAYGPFGLGYGGYGMSYYGGGGGSSSFDDDRDDRPTGSIRLRVSPSTARVYIDGALVGIVDDFDGFTDHLDLDPGAHQLELRAPGYEPYSTAIEVKEGKTLTTRAGLKKSK